MNWDQIEGRWKQMRGAVKAKWGKFNDSHIDLINGRRDQLIGLIQQRYGLAKEAAEKQVIEWAASIRLAEGEPRRKVG